MISTPLKTVASSPCNAAVKFTVVFVVSPRCLYDADAFTNEIRLYFRYKISM